MLWAELHIADFGLRPVVAIAHPAPGFAPSPALFWAQLGEAAAAPTLFLSVLPPCAFQLMLLNLWQQSVTEILNSAAAMQQENKELVFPLKALPYLFPYF